MCKEEQSCQDISLVLGLFLNSQMLIVEGQGFYKYRCKYFLTHNCQNWLYVIDRPCANCLVSPYPKDSLTYVQV